MKEQPANLIFLFDHSEGHTAAAPRTHRTAEMNSSRTRSCVLAFLFSTRDQNTPRPRATVTLMSRHNIEVDSHFTDDDVRSAMMQQMAYYYTRH